MDVKHVISSVRLYKKKKIAQNRTLRWTVLCGSVPACEDSDVWRGAELEKIVKNEYKAHDE